MSLEGVDPPQGKTVLRALNRGGGFPRLQLIPPGGAQGGGPPAFSGFEGIENPIGDFQLLLAENPPTTFGNIVIDETGIVPFDWFDTDWLGRVAFAVNPNQIFELNFNFKLLIDGTFEGLKNLADVTGKDIRFAGKDKVQLEYEIEEFDKTTGRIVAWVKIPIIEDDYVVYLYYGNPTATDAQDSAAVWAADHLAAWHMNQTTFGANSTIDSTKLDATNNNFTPSGMVAGVNDVEGKPGPSLLFREDENDFTTGLSSTAIRNLTNDFTVSIWFNTSRIDNNESLISQLVSGGYRIAFVTPTRIVFSAIGVKAYFIDVPEISTNSFIHLVTVFDSNNDVTFYLDGVKIGTITGSNPMAAAGGGYTIGAAGPTANMFNGIIGDLRIIDKGLSEFEVQDIFNNESDQQKFFSQGIDRVLPIPIPADWFDVRYLRRIPITIKNGQLIMPENNFPFLFNSTVLDLNNARADGFDFRFAGTDKVELKYERQEFDNVTGKLIAHIKFPEIQDGTLVYMYYNNPTSTDGEDKNGVWDANYKAVYHMSQTPGAAGSILDSTSNNNNGDPVNSPIQTTGKIGKAIQFDGVDQEIEILDDPSLDIPNAITLEAWVETADTAGGIIERFLSGFAGYRVALDASDYLFTLETATPMSINTPKADNNFHHVVAIKETPLNLLSFIIDGILIPSVTIDPNPTINIPQNARIGNSNDKGFLNGKIDEVRISDIARGRDFIFAEHRNQNNPSAFYDIGDVQQIPASTNIPADWLNTNFKNRIPLTVKAGQIIGSLTDFPLLFNSTVADFIANANVNGFDFRFALPGEGEAFELKYERQSYISGTGGLIAHVKIPTIQDGTLVYLYYNNSGVTDGQDPVNVWTNDYLAVYHMNDTGSTLINSLGVNDAPLTIGTNAPLTTGQIGQAKNFPSGLSAYQIPGIVNVSPGPVTVSAWATAERRTLNVGLVTDRFTLAPNENEFSLGFLFSTNNAFAGFFDDGAAAWQSAENNLVVTDNSMHYWVGTYDQITTQQIKLYIDSILVATTPNTLPLPMNTMGWNIGHRWDTEATAAFSWEGIIDEVRISKIDRTADWIKAEFNNQSNPSAFYEIGDVETIS